MKINLWNADQIELQDMPTSDFETHRNTSAIAKLLVENVPGTCYDEIVNAIESQIVELVKSGYTDLLSSRFFVSGHIRSVLSSLAYPEG